MSFPEDMLWAGGHGLTTSPDLGYINFRQIILVEQS